MPSNSARPPTWTPRFGSNPMIASDVTLLPHPDSPTRPTTSPASIENDTPSTAFTTRWPLRANRTDKSVTSSNATRTTSLPQLGIEGLTH
jgi:hypothetical protein